VIYEIPKSGEKAPHPLKVSSLSEHGWREKKLEDYLFRHLRQLVSTDLMVIGQSSVGEKADLVALDSEGELWLFELKKVGGKAEHLLQVMRYSQLFGSGEIRDLDKLYRENQEDPKESLAVAFCEYFGYDRNRAVTEGEKLGKRHHLVVMTDGTDDETLSAIAHWQRHDLDIQAWPYRIYKGTTQSFHLDLPELLIKGKRISQKPAPVFFVNTSRKKLKAASDMENYMLEHQCALATGEPWIHRITRIPAGAKVMLYANRIGIIAIGIATHARWIDNPPELNREITQNLKLREFSPLKPPLSVQEIFRIAGYHFRVTTVCEPKGDAGQRVWKAAIERP